jgi:hypothetical protein
MSNGLLFYVGLSLHIKNKNIYSYPNTCYVSRCSRELGLSGFSLIIYRLRNPDFDENL